MTTYQGTRLFTVTELAEILKMNRNTCYARIDDGLIPRPTRARGLQRRRYYQQSDIDAIVEQERLSKAFDAELSAIGLKAVRANKEKGR